MSRKIDWNGIGIWISDSIRSNGGKIVGGITMIGFALLCKKLNLPFSVLTDPYDSMNNMSVSAQIPIVDTSIMLVPNNTVEASIVAICDNAKTMRDNYYKNQAANQILEILRKQKTLDDSTKTYAVMCIRAIAATCNDNYYKNQMLRAIQSIAEGRYW